MNKFSLETRSFLAISTVRFWNSLQVAVVKIKKTSFKRKPEKVKKPVIQQDSCDSRDPDLVTRTSVLYS